MTMKYKFMNNDDASQRILVCPGCGEQLTCADIEIFPACPFCDHALEKNGELEDFILEPLVRRWINRYNTPFIVEYPPTHPVRASLRRGN